MNRQEIAMATIGLLAASTAMSAGVSELATGGVRSTLSNGMVLHLFTNAAETATFHAAAAGDYEIMLIGGGGSGGNTFSGGGGAGGVIFTNVSLASGDYTVTVGSGGEPPVSIYTHGTSGGSSIFGEIEAFGGGWGGGFNDRGGYAGAGGSGGGGAGYGGNGTPGQGFNGGDGNGSGGGGAGGPGNADGNGVGGEGIYTNFCGTWRWYAGGGSGQNSAARSLGGTFRNEDGEANTGAGGGAEIGNNGNDAGNYLGKGRGGSGIVAVRYFYDARLAAQGSLLGGDIVEDREIDGTKYRVHIFTNSAEIATLTVERYARYDLMVIGGGGGGGNTYSGGGGAGGVVFTTLAMLPGEYQVTVGVGGAGGQTYISYGENGGDSSVYGIVAYGGGAGAPFNNSRGRDGASGGGGAGTGAGAGGLAIYGDQGHNGGAYGGGGGYGGPGYDVSADEHRGRGGAGIYTNFTGEARWYAAGGNAQSASWSDDSEGATLSNHSGAPNSGCGGGAETGNNANDGPLSLGLGNGGSGIVAIRYELLPTGTAVFLR